MRDPAAGRHDRRQFLRTGVAGVVAAAVGTTPASSGVREARRQGGPHVAVVGAGCFGGWTASALLERGARVTLIDAWGAGNSRSSSGDETRVIRSIYNGSDLYTDMVTRAFVSWREAEARWGRPVFRRTGALWMFEVDDGFARRSLPLLRARGIPVDELSPRDVARRYPQVRVDGVRTAFFEPEGGFLLARESCELVRAQVVAAGGRYVQARVARPSVVAGRLGGLSLSDGSTVVADAYVFACGPWLGEVFPDVIGNGIIATRQDVFYFGSAAGDGRFDESSFPVWVNFGARLMYGIPGNERRGFKVADDTEGPQVDPSTLERIPAAAAIARARATLRRRFPALAAAPIVESRVCQYEYSPDGDFLVDRHPGADNAWLVGGGSGHGFKMGPALGAHAAARIVGLEPAEPRFSYGHFAAGWARVRRTRTRTRHS